MLYRHKLRISCFLLVDITSYSTRCPPLTVKVSPHFKQTLKNDVTGRNSSFCRIASPYGIVIFIKLKPPESRYGIAIAVGRQIVYSIPHCYYFFLLNTSQFNYLVKEKKKSRIMGDKASLDRCGQQHRYNCKVDQESPKTQLFL